MHECRAPALAAIAVWPKPARLRHWLGLTLISVSSDLAVFWPASGVAAGILIELGRRALPAVVIGVVVGSAAANLMSNRSLVTCLLNGSWKAGDAVLAAWLLERWFGRPFTFVDLRRVAGFLAAASFATAARHFESRDNDPVSCPDRCAKLGRPAHVVLVEPNRICRGRATRGWASPRVVHATAGRGMHRGRWSYTTTQKTVSWLSFSPSAFVPPLLLWLTARCRTPFEIAGAFLASGAILRGVITATSIDQANGRFPWE